MARTISTTARSNIANFLTVSSIVELPMVASKPFDEEMRAHTVIMIYSSSHLRGMGFSKQLRKKRSDQVDDDPFKRCCGSTWHD